MQGLDDIDVAKTADDALIRERDFKRRPAPCERRGQRSSIERLVQRLRSKSSQRFVSGMFVSIQQRHEAEPARVVEGHDLAIRHLEHDVIMELELRRHDAEPSRHTEMHQQSIAGGELHDQIFRSALDRANSLPF